MALVIEATYEKGVFVPLDPPSLPEHGRVRLHVETIAAVVDGAARIDYRRHNRIRLDPVMASWIAADKELRPENG